MILRTKVLNPIRLFDYEPPRLTVRYGACAAAVVPRALRASGRSEFRWITKKEDGRRVFAITTPNVAKRRAIMAGNDHVCKETAV